MFSTHLDSMKYISDDMFKVTSKKLTAISDEIGADLDKTNSREKHINQQLVDLVTKLRESHDRLKQAKVGFREMNMP